MKYTFIEGPTGTRKVPEGTVYRLAPGEKVVGDPDRKPHSAKLWVLDKLSSYFGIAVADVILYGAKAFNIPPCSTCEMRYKVLHVIEQIGLIKAIRLLAKTIRGQELTDDEVALVEASFYGGLDKSDSGVPNI